LKGDADSAALLYRRAAAVPGADPRREAEIHYNLGDLDIAARAWQSAVAELERSVRADSTNPAYPNNLGFALIKSGRAGDALALLESSVRRFPSYPYLWKNAGMAALELRQDSVAVAYLDRALDLDHGLVEAHGLRAEARARLGDRAGARADWDAFASASPAPEQRGEVEEKLRVLGVLP
jgi:tetratricopeptide (TPR) repeat protein